MSSLTDIVFLLLIFFMLTSTLVVPHALNLTLPKATTPTIIPQTTQVFITENLEYYVNDTKVPLNRLQDQIYQEIRNQENPTIVINTDHNVSIGQVTRVLSIAQKLNVSVLLATEPE